MGSLEFVDSDQFKIGIKQSIRAINDDLARTVYIAKDADVALTAQLVRLSEERQVPIVYAESKRELGRLCHIDVGAATAVVLK